MNECIKNIFCVFLCFFVAIILASSIMATEVIKIVAAENVYGGIAQQIGDSSVTVVSIMNNPNQDPHEFQADSATAKAVADADIIIYNGIGYDSWMEKLLGTRGKPGRQVIKVSDLVGAKMGDNPHLWYDPKTMPALATRLSNMLSKKTELLIFLQSMQPFLDKIVILKERYHGISVSATEPLFGLMASALDWKMLNNGYQLAIMNGTEPSFKQIIDFQKSLTSKKIQLLFYNSQVMNPATAQLQKIAQQNGIPVLGIAETQPATSKNYQEWMIQQLSEVERALK
ncbi:MAG: hypothetical protein A3F67_03180 [Verrucomicrobia bacterium RIFCSPHIGHO2_12_FULL_41_10]|nr:MAG: hypothetical protein A3F67_03180 [Verrucomicrobia bacterium RIFCSPHIGHO2_12_FULL_41_10]HLB33608.1 zinc ABC transporter substrate-binding protein [Chthoniobacterales bacterium]